MCNINLNSINLLRRSFFLVLFGLLSPVFFQITAQAQCISLDTSGAAYTQNFVTLSNTAGSTTNSLAIPGFFLNETGGGARDNEQYAVDTGGSTTGDTYSYGAAGSTDRALGSLRSGTLISTFGACFTNNTGVIINRLDVAYTGEEWRLGTAGRTDQLNFEYSLNATSLTTGTYTPVPALNFVTPNTATIGAKDGNAAENRTALSSSITGISIPLGATFYIRWTDADASGADDGLAVDDFSLTPFGTTAASAIVSGRVITSDGRGIRNVLIRLIDGNGETRTVSTTTFGYFNFRDVPAGQTYTLSAFAKKYRFTQPTQILSVTGDMPELIFIAEN